jgi:two-component system LytT family sensor kinase
MNWTINFALVDFKNLSQLHAKSNALHRYLRIGLSSVAAVALFLLIGFAVEESQLLTQISGDQIGSFRAWFFLLLRILLFNALFILIKYLFDSNEEKQYLLLQNEVLKRETLHAQHEILKQQVNPHFLFNSLNTLYSLVKRDSAQALMFVTELAAVYRYMLLHKDKTMVSLQEEIDFLKSYIYLLKIRFGDAIFVEICIEEHLTEQSMPPNTLQLLIENAVKHNQFTLKRPLQIAVFVQEEYLVVKNNLQERNEQTTSFHVGLSNISSRYRLLHGKDILIEKTTAYFQVLLPL